MKKCVIIGSGLGGLSCGCILAKNGYEVTVLEQGEQIGGCLQCFRRGGAIFDTGMHYIGSADEGQALHTIMKYLGVVDEIQLSRLDSTGYDIISLRGEHYRFVNGKENFIDSLAAHFPSSRDELNRYYELVQLVASSSAMHSLNRDVDVNMNAEYQTRSVNDVIDGVITNPLLKQVLAGIQPLYAGEENLTSFSTHALITDFYNQSAFRIVGGSSHVADSLSGIITGLGGKVLPLHKVMRIECNDSQATAVITENGECFPADLVISAIHPTNTVKLLDSHLIRPAYRNRLENVRNTTSIFTVYLKFKKDRVKYMNHNLYFYRTPSTWGCDKYDASNWPKCLLYMHFCNEPSPVYAQTGEIMTYMSFNEVEQWASTQIGRRGESYEDFKRKKAEALIAALEQEVPSIRDDIESYFTSTPLTYRDYTGTPNGAMYGVAKDVNTLGTGSISTKTRIPNLLLAGQSITSHGMHGVLAGSLMTCAEVLTTDKIFEQLKSVN